MPTVSDVRKLLGDVSTELLPDDVILHAIDEASEYVALRAGSTSSPYAEKLILYRAASLSLLSYIEVARRELGSVPESARFLLDEYKELSQQFERLLLSEVSDRKNARSPATVVLIPTYDPYGET